MLEESPLAFREKGHESILARKISVQNSNWLQESWILDFEPARGMDLHSDSRIQESTRVNVATTREQEVGDGRKSFASCSNMV